MKRQLQFFALACAMLILSACASLGVPTPDTFNKKLAVAVATVTEVRNTGATLLSAGKISASDAANIEKQADTAREGLNVARTLSGKDLAGADNKLTAATAILQALQTYLLTKQGS
jgi:hypothetical protein